jgi:hypothetical protein
MKSSVWKSLMDQGLVEKKVERKPRKKSKFKKRNSTTKKSGEVKAGSIAGSSAGTLLMVEKATAKLKASAKSSGENRAISRVLSQATQRAKDTARTRLSRNWQESFAGVMEQLAAKPMPAAPSPKMSSIQLQMEMPSIDFQQPRRGNRIPMASRRSVPVPRNGLRGASVLRSPPLMDDISDQSRRDARLLRMQMQGVEYDGMDDAPLLEEQPRRISSPLADQGQGVSYRLEMNRLRAARARAATTDSVMDPNNYDKGGDPEPVSPLVHPKFMNSSGTDAFPPLSAGARASNETVHPWTWSFASNMTLDEYMDQPPISLASALDRQAAASERTSDMEFMSARSDRPRPRPPSNPKNSSASGAAGVRSLQQEAAHYRAAFLEQQGSGNFVSSSSSNDQQRRDPLLSLRRSVVRQKKKSTTNQRDALLRTSTF